ncbi:MAG TPA: Clp protease N-terminal domain-containing protein [Gemmatimonadaceae bacterium]|jgi:ATP-dependent Clp protease ATP-binding subunit ClpA
MNGYNFTERVRKVLAMAREEAVALSHEYVGTEHILLGLLREGEGVASTVVQNLNIELDALRTTILNVVKRGRGGQTTGPDLPYTSRAKKVLELAMSEARELDHTYVGTEHLLLGLLREKKGIAAQVLEDAGLTVEKAREETLRILGTQSPPPTNAPEGPPRMRASLFASGNAAAEHLPKSARRVREIIGSAHDVAVERQSPIMAPTHLAIALLRHEGGMANAALDRLNFDRAAVLSALNDVAPRGTTPVDPEGVVAPEAGVVIAIEAMEKLRRESNAPTAGSHHLLLALVMTSPDVDFAFAGQHLDVNMIRESVRWISG